MIWQFGFENLWLSRSSSMHNDNNDNNNNNNSNNNNNNNNNKYNNNNNKCPGYDIKLHPVVEFRRGIMRLPFAAITSRSPLSKVWYLSALPETMKYRVGVRQGIVCLMGGRDSLVLAGNPPSDGVMIKILVGETLQHTPHFNERMSNTELNPNDVNDTGAFSEGVASGRCPVDQQCRPGRHPATAEHRQKRLGW